MAVVIDEMVAEPVPAASTPGAPAASGGEGSAEPDYEKLDYEFRRARQRSARLFAD